LTLLAATQADRKLRKWMDKRVKPNVAHYSSRVVRFLFPAGGIPLH
jgi:hypothetical protein